MQGAYDTALAGELDGYPAPQASQKGTETGLPLQLFYTSQQDQAGSDHLQGSAVKKKKETFNIDYSIDTLSSHADVLADAMLQQTDFKSD